uniref:Protein krueppel n=1 Tax=Anopheles atroparvus TaxID=41427 RepID=A0AAG5D7G2_ANOAO
MRNDYSNDGLHSVCRFCLNSECVNTIFDHDTIDIVSVVRFVTQLEISSDDAHTKFICEGCREFIESIVEFRERCIQSYNTLQNQQLLDTVSVEEFIEECSEPGAEEDYRLEFIKCESPHAETIPGTGEDLDELEHLEHETNSRSDVNENEDQLQIEVTLPGGITVDKNAQSCKRMQEPLSDQDTLNIAVCPLCGERFTGGKIMVRHHIKSDHADDDTLPKIRQCFFCPKAYSSYQLLKYHLNFHPQKVWHCPQCGQRIVKKGIFIDHLRIHANERHYECKVCGKRFTTMKYLSTHRQLHKLQEAQGCNKVASTTDVHRKDSSVACNDTEQQLCRNDVGQQEQTFQCSICPKEFHLQALLNIHLQCDHVPKDDSMGRHFECKMYECEICGKQMKFKSNYTNHRKTHKDNSGMQGETHGESCSADLEHKKVYLCNICGHNCGSSSNLTVHLRRHNGESICQCSVCGKGYPRKSDLVMHMRTHTGEKPFKCKSCGKGFSRRDKLRIHTRIHTGEKPYECPCGRAYAQKNDLKTHQKRNICGQNFDMSKLLAPYPTSICIKSPNRAETPPQSMDHPQIEKDVGTLIQDTPQEVSKDQAELLVAAEAVADMVETTNWGHFMTVAFPKQDQSATSVDFDDVSFSSQPKLYS